MIKEDNKQLKVKATLYVYEGDLEYNEDGSVKNKLIQTIESEEQEI